MSLRLSILSLSASLFIFLQSAQGETYRCSFNREVAVGANGLFEDNKDPRKGEVYFVTLGSLDRGGKVSQCASAGQCGTVANVQLLTRWASNNGKSTMVRLVIGSEQQIGQIWSIESNHADGEFTLVAVSALEQRSDTGFGACRKVVD